MLLCLSLSAHNKILGFIISETSGFFLSKRHFKLISLDMALFSEYTEASELGMSQNSTASPSNRSSSLLPLGYGTPHLILTASVLTIIMIIIVFGNLLVVIAIFCDRNLKSKQNWFIASLAVADFLLGLLIMPFSLANELMGYWYFGSVWCDLWKAIDVLLCTASILSICLISLDRYWSITKAIQYARKRTSTRAALMITSVWVLSAITCVPPLIGWKNPLPVTEYPLCLLSEELGYVIYSSMGSFYIPAVIMVFVYYHIYVAAKTRARRHSKKKVNKKKEIKKKETNKESDRKGHSEEVQIKLIQKVTNVDSSLALSEDESKWPMYQKPSAETDERTKLLCLPTSPESKENERVSDESGNKSSCLKQSIATVNNDLNSNEKSDADKPGPHKMKANDNHDCVTTNKNTGHDNESTSSCDVIDDTQTIEVNMHNNKMDHSTNITPPKNTNGGCSQQDNTIKDLEKQKRKLAKSRERRATIVLGLVMAAFILCWFPFFTLYIITSFCFCIPNSVFTVAFWAGYCNSALNPIIYTVFNRDFRNAFKRILFGKLICRR